MHLDGGLGPDRVEIRAAAHRAPMPVIEDAPGREDEGVFVVGHLALCTILQFPELAATARELILEEVWRAGMIFGGARPVNAAFAVDAVVGDAAEIRCQAAHFFPYIGWVFVVEASRLFHIQPLLDATR